MFYQILPTENKTIQILSYMIRTHFGSRSWPRQAGTASVFAAILHCSVVSKLARKDIEVITVQQGMILDYNKG
jgi:hypothetical protein